MINSASTRIGSRSKWHGVPEKETSACLKNRLDRLEKGIHVFLRTSLTSRKEFPSFKGSHDRARRRKHRPNCWPKFVIQTYIYIYIYIYFHTGSVGGQAADSQERGSLRLAPINTDLSASFLYVCIYIMLMYIQHITYGFQQLVCCHQ